MLTIHTRHTHQVRLRLNKRSRCGEFIIHLTVRSHPSVRSEDDTSHKKNGVVAVRLCRRGHAAGVIGAAHEHEKALLAGQREHHARVQGRVLR
jgi:hypothetical protein